MEASPASGPSLELIEAIYREHAPRFRRAALAIVADVDTADDVVQEAFASAVVSRGSFRGTGAATAWIWRIVVNTALSRRRRGRLESRILEWMKLGLRTAEPAARDEDALREQVARLPERHKP